MSRFTLAQLREMHERQVEIALSAYPETIPDHAAREHDVAHALLFRTLRLQLSEGYGATVHEQDVHSWVVKRVRVDGELQTLWAARWDPTSQDVLMLDGHAAGQTFTVHKRHMHVVMVPDEDGAPVPYTLAGYDDHERVWLYTRSGSIDGEDVK